MSYSRRKTMISRIRWRFIRIRSWFELKLGWGSRKWMEKKLDKMFTDITQIGNILEVPQEAEAKRAASRIRHDISELQASLGFETYEERLYKKFYKEKG